MALKTNTYQIGQSATASNNFVLKTDGAGALQICRGNMGEEGGPLLTIDAEGGFSFTPKPLVWTPLTLINGWAPVDLATCRIAKDQLGFVHIEGAVYGGPTVQEFAFTPADMKPPQNVVFAIYTSDVTDGVTALQMSTDGSMHIFSSPNTTTGKNYYFYGCGYHVDN